MTKVFVLRVVICPGCKGENVKGAWDRSEARWSGHCLTCGLRFWHRR